MFDATNGLGLTMELDFASSSTPPPRNNGQMPIDSASSTPAATVTQVGAWGLRRIVRTRRTNRSGGDAPRSTCRATSAWPRSLGGPNISKKRRKALRTALDGMLGTARNSVDEHARRVRRNRVNAANVRRACGATAIGARCARQRRPASQQMPPSAPRTRICPRPHSR